MPGTIEPREDRSGTDVAPPARRGVYLLTHPRSASNLFQSMMAKQPGYQNSGYKLFDAVLPIMSQLDKGPLREWPAQEREVLYDSFKQAFGTMQDELDDAKKIGKQVFMKEHAVLLYGPDKMFGRLYNEEGLEPLVVHERGAAPDAPHTNPSSVPDGVLLSLQPIFQIRHPVLMFPSLVRAQRDVKWGGRPSDHYGRLVLSLFASRALYDWYVEHGARVGIVPRVIDADDIMKEPEAVRQLCRQTGLDPDAVVYEWEERKVDDPLQARFLSTIASSKGIVPGLTAKGKNIEDEKVKWVQEFGQEDADDLEKAVYAAMPDYEYLYSKRTVAK